MAIDKGATNVDFHTDVDRDGILGERFYHKFQYMMKNWDNEDKQFNLALGNFDDMNRFVTDQMKVEKVPILPP